MPCKMAQVVAWVTILFIGCTHTYNFTHLPATSLQQKLNAYGHRFGGKLIQQDGTVVLFSQIMLDGNQLKLYPRGDTTTVAIPIAQVDRVVFTDHILGAGYGAWLGAFLGGIAGGFYVNWQFEGMNGLALLFGGMAGILAGTVTGAIMGSKIIFRFAPGVKPTGQEKIKAGSGTPNPAFKKSSYSLREQ